MTEYIRAGECFECHRCCKEFRMKIDYRITGDKAEYYRARGWEITLGPRSTLMVLPKLRCLHLLLNDVCDLKATNRKPMRCYLYPQHLWELLPSCGYRFEKTK